jgi:hypothetical protein
MPDLPPQPIRTASGNPVPAPGGEAPEAALRGRHRPAIGLPITRRRSLLAVLTMAAIGQRPAAGQFPEAEKTGAGPILGDVREQRFRVGMTVTAVGGPCRGLYATLPVPDEWPEQRVTIEAEDCSADVRALRYRTLPGGVKQMVVEIPDLPAGERARAVVTLSLARAALLPPADTAGLEVPEKPERSLRPYLAPSPYIESRHPKIVKLAKATAGELRGWALVEAIYDTVREKVEYRNGPLKGAARALADGWGDCEELTCLFIAMARAVGVPARTVWVEGHCYPEFHLVDGTGAGWWFPCQAAGSRAFGGMPDQLPILQKGDAFRDPDRPAQTLRYVSEFARGTTTDGGGSPKITWIREGA